MSTTPSHAERARTLAASRTEGALCTLAREPEGHPYGSLVIYAMVDARPIFLLSKLAEHTRNLETDARASLLIAEREGGDALARGRVTLVGTCARIEDQALAQARQRRGRASAEREPGGAAPDNDHPSVEDAFLARHPDARAYASFADFGYFALEVESARWVGGFGRMSWIDAGAWRAAEPDPLLDARAGILEHMNDDHADACLAYATALAGVEGATEARMIDVDRYGFDLRVTTAEGARSVRLAFDSPVASATEVRKALVAMVRAARSR